MGTIPTKTNAKLSYSNVLSTVALLSLLGLGVWAASCKTTDTTQKQSGGGGGIGDAGDIDQDVYVVPPGDGYTGPGGDDGETLDRDAIQSDGSGRAASGLWEPEKGDFVLKDRETGSLWNVRGEAYAGPLKGTTLDQVPAFNAFWFAWSVFYHGSEIWRADAENIRNTPGELGSGDNCLVPCDEIELGCSGKDCIPALDYAGRSYGGRERPKKHELVEPGGPDTSYLDDRELVAGVVVEGQARAYPLNVYTHHEIHNDRAGDREFTLTFCPLTGSAIVFDGSFEDRPIRFGVSGRLFESNLVMFDPGSDTFWSQLLGRGIKGEHKGDRLKRLPVVETTWERWKEMYPETLVPSSETGYDRNYNNYLYGDYRTNHGDTFGASQHQDTYKAKKRVLGLPADDKREAKVFPFPELEKLPGDRNIIHTTFRGEPLIIVWEKEHRMAIPFRTEVETNQGTLNLTFTGKLAE